MKHRYNYEDWRKTATIEWEKQETTRRSLPSPPLPEPPAPGFPVRPDMVIWTFPPEKGHWWRV